MAKQVKQELVTKAEELHNELTVVLEALKTDFVKCNNFWFSCNCTGNENPINLFLSKAGEVTLIRKP